MAPLQGAWPRLACDLPIDRTGTVVHNELLLTGWALSPEGIAGVIVQVDDRVLHASYGLDTPWAAESIPDIESAARAGYRLAIDTSTWEPGLRDVTITAYSQDRLHASVSGQVDVIPYGPPPATRDDRRAAISAGEPVLALELPPVHDDSSEIETPVLISGWAYAAGGIEAVLVTIDGQTRYEALHPITRPDLLDDWGDNVAASAGFVLRLHERDCRPGWHRLSVVAIGAQRRAVGVETAFRNMPEPQPDSPPEPGEVAAVTWVQEPRPARPRRRSAISSSATGIDRALGEVERRLRHDLAAALAPDGADILAVGPSDPSEPLPHDDASFDLVTCLDGVGCVEALRPAVEDFRRVLRRDGVLAIGVTRQRPTNRREEGPDTVERLVSDLFAHVQVVRQRALLASVLTTDAELADEGARLELSVDQLSEMRPGSERHLVVLASDAPLPALQALATLAPQGALRELAGAIDNAEDRARVAEAAAAASRNESNLACMHQEATVGEWRETQRERDIARQALSEARQALSEALAELESARTRVEEANASTAEQAGQLEKRAARLHAQAEALTVAEARATGAERAVEALQRSLSWRVTRPLRAVKRVVRRGRRHADRDSS